MASDEPRQIAHALAARSATEFVKAAADAGLSWTEIAIAGETIVAIVVAATAEMSGRADSERFAQEMVETITERAHGRVQALIRGIPYAG